MKKILVLGAAGMAGHMISSYLKTMPEKYEVYDVVHYKNIDEGQIAIDIRNLDLLNQVLYSINPEIVINAVGILNKNAEDNPPNTIFINSYFPRYMEQRLKATNIKFIHLSTDCVFSGGIGRYSETSPTDGKDLYAKTKILGEINNCKDLTIRTSIIGPELKENGTGLFHWFMKQSGTVKGYSKVIWSGVTTLELSKCIDKMIEEDLTGLYNLTVQTPINKYELLKTFKAAFSKSVQIENCEEVISDKSLISERTDFLVNLPSYTEMISELKAWMLKNKRLYSQYF